MSGGELFFVFGDYIKTAGIIIGGFIAAYQFFRRVFLREMKDRLEVFENSLKELTDSCIEQRKSLTEIVESQKLSCKADQDILKALITNRYYQYKKLCYFPMYERECLSTIYKDYKDLRGNSFIDRLYDELMSLPADPYEK